MAIKNYSTESKPLKCKYPNCFQCVYVDCRYSALEYLDIKMQDEFERDLEVVEPEIAKHRISQRKYSKTQKGKDAFIRYSRTEKYKEKQRRYEKSENGKERKIRYFQTEKGKEKERRKTQKRIASGKNAEYCRNYYYRKKEKENNKKSNLEVEYGIAGI